MPDLRPEPETSDESVRFLQSAGGRTALPAPRRVKNGGIFHVRPPVAWTTLALTLYRDGTSKHEVVGASAFLRHWIYDRDGDLTAKSGVIDFMAWYEGAHEQHTPWGAEDSPALVTEVESAWERKLSYALMHSNPRPEMRKLEPGDSLVKQGERGSDLFRLLDGVLSVEVDGEAVAQLGPGAIVGERAHLEGGTRKATLRAVTNCRVAVGAPEQFSNEALEAVAARHR